MTVSEFSDGFDTLINAYSQGVPFGDGNGGLEFTEYEKSVFLTEAQEKLIVSLYNGRNTEGLSFESSEEVRRDLEPLVIQAENSCPVSTYNKLSEKHQVFRLNDNVWFIVFESVDWDTSESGCLPSEGIHVQPITHDEYHKVKDNPFRGPSDRRVLRLDVNAGYSENDKTRQYVEIVSKYAVSTYRYRYIRHPKPIILDNLSDEGVTVDGGKYMRTSELGEPLHQGILELAVTLALQSRGISVNK